MILHPYGDVTLRDWVRRLRCFRICGSVGAHFDEPDSLRLLFRCGTVKELLELLGGVGFREIRRDGDTWLLDGHRVSLGASGAGTVGLNYLGRGEFGWILNNEQIAGASEFEARLGALLSLLEDPPYPPELCVTKDTYPELWRADV